MSLPHHDPTTVAERLEASRRNLLDMSRRNRLINYRPSRASGVEVIGEDPFEVFRILVTEARAMTLDGWSSSRDEELEAAVELVVRECFEGDPDEAASLAVRKLGFERLTAPMRERLVLVIEVLKESGRVFDREGRLHVP